MKHIAIIASLSLSACSGLSGETPVLTAGAAADALTTTIALADGAAEMNPVLAPFGEGAGIAALGVKYAGTEALIQAGMNPDFAIGAMDSMSWVGACNNFALMAGMSGLQNTILVGVACGIGAAEFKHDLRNTPVMAEDAAND